MKRIPVLLLVAFVASPSLAQPVDGSMSCEQILAEAGRLETAAAAADAAQARRAGDARVRRGVLGGFAKGAISVAPALVGGRIGGWGGYAAQSALNGAASASIAQAPATPAAPQVTPERRRLEELNMLRARRGC